ncbi:related to Probable metabolite transport protein YBR241C [Saccharomycodes ludwigii]|uniref:Related to Probable metabolite transport protein YBR241C n=1 Tax=Saccharomycodes ludwigii TaxID=36035 RepID=A0A376B5N9_9ASCO|nr:hypothetical protein SCDLUD_001032 [Saccharomycodes ludwigii]KAH3903397.1 hypothetical protein SCDLUD_001032 [Saccharomycodes ludwigii]SSD60016.1 related to Probable metabolite transport protein YBR241C [Saccharomycodes ludwigii]
MADTNLLPSSYGRPESPKEKSVTNKLLFATIVACFGSLQYGYHMAELNAPQSVLSCHTTGTDNAMSDPLYYSLGLKNCVAMSEQQIGLITSVFSIGGLFGSLYAGVLADIHGRRKISFFNAFLSILGSLLLTFSNSFTQFLIGRLTCGLAAGSSVVVTPLLLTEIAPNNLKGALGSMNQVSINLGILLTQVLSLKWATINQWRNILFVGVILATINFILLFKVHESPKWLVNRGYLDEAEDVLRGLRGGTRADTRNEINEWLSVRSVSRTQLSKQQDENNNNGSNSNLVMLGPSPANNTKQNNKKDSSYQSLHARSTSPLVSAHSNREFEENEEIKEISMWQYIKSNHYNKSRFMITMILMGQQFVGINSIICYGVKVIGDLVSEGNTAIIVNVGISILNVVVTFASSPLIDKWGRKPLLIGSSFSMGLSSLFISYGLKANSAQLLIFFTFLYIGVFAIGMGPIPFLVISELTPDEAIGAAQSYGTTCNWIAVFIVAYGFPVLDSIIGISPIFIIFGVVAFLFSIFVYYRFPETKGRSTKVGLWD